MFQPEIQVETAGMVLLDDEDSAGRRRFAGFRLLGGCGGGTLKKLLPTPGNGSGVCSGSRLST